MHFSRLADDLGGTTNPLYALREDLRKQGRAIVDLVGGNVTEHGVVFPEGLLKEILAEAVSKASIYRPHSIGQEIAREAVACYYGSPAFRTDHILITPGTSISYWYCFKLLAEAGDEILCPQPSYPLFDYIARLCDVTLKPYRLLESHQWEIDLDHLEFQISDRTRAIVLISPHNPTGMVASEKQLQGLAEIASRRNLPIISDEVFSEFLFGAQRSFPRPALTEAPLVFTLNGFSKMFALPGMKIGWMAVAGRAELVSKVMPALEMMSDTFLPVNETAQFAVPGIFQRGRPFVANYAEWVATCRDAAVSALNNCTYCPPQGGFYVTLPVDGDEDNVAARLLKEEGILVHPGYFYDIDGDHIVMTFIQEPAVVRQCFTRIARFCRKANSTPCDK